MVTRKFERYFSSEAITLDPHYVKEGDTEVTGHFSRTTGLWTVSGEIVEDYFYWVNNFKATHLIHGTVEGNFETGITGPSDEVIDLFLQEFPPNRWDYYDI